MALVGLQGWAGVAGVFVQGEGTFISRVNSKVAGVAKGSERGTDLLGRMFGFGP
jgi:hypothetical protein